MTRKIFTITGELGSGKSTVSKHLASLFSAHRYSTGDIQRQIAKSRGISTLELNLLAEKDHSIDDEIDSVFASLKNINDNLVIDSRMAWHFIPESIKIKLLVSPEEAAHRIHLDDSRISESAKTVSETFSKLMNRRESERRRFLKYYGVDLEDNNNFDFVIDTSAANPKEIALLIKALSEGKNNAPQNIFWVSPKNIFPTKDIKTLIQENTFCNTAFDYNSPVSIIKTGHDYFIHQGHKKISGAIKSHLSFVPVKISTGKPIVNLSWIHRWEEAHHFRFGHYPKGLRIED